MSKNIKFLILFSFLPVANATLHPEKYYQDMYCTGKTEVLLPDRTRIDCETSDYAIEFDFAHKWAEAIGQSLHYAEKTGKFPGIVLIVESPDQCRFIPLVKDVIDRYWLPIRLQTVPLICD